MCVSVLSDAVHVSEEGSTLPEDESHSKSQTFNLSPVGRRAPHREFCPGTILYGNQRGRVGGALWDMMGGVMGGTVAPSDGIRDAPFVICITLLHCAVIVSISMCNEK